jgi:hypothetical protein
VRKVLLLGLLAAGAPGGCAGHRAAIAPGLVPAPEVPAPAVAPSVAPAGASVPDAEPAAVEAPGATPTPGQPDVFRAEVAPLLARRCAPCHNPGGKMYEALPFDDPATVASHPEGILKRFKDPAEHTLIEQWIASRPKS